MSDDPSERGAPSPPGRPRLNTLGEERPSFLLEFPDDPELERLIAAFEDGDFARIRREAPALAQRTHDEGVRRAALELRRRIDPDPLLLVLLGLSLALFAVIVAWVYSR